MKDDEVNILSFGGSLDWDWVMNPINNRAQKCISEERRVDSSPKLFWLALLLLSSYVRVAMPAANTPQTYADIAPILTARCILCHTGEGAPAGLRLDSFEAIIKGGLKAAVVIAGDPANSELIRRIKGIAQPRMPLTGPPFLTDNEIARFEGWVAAGLQPGEAAPAETPAKVTPSRPDPGATITYADVAPIFATRCAKCHTDNGLMGPAPEGYRLTSYEATLATSDRVRVVPGNPGASELVRRIRGQARPGMPFDGPPFLTDGEIRLIEDWIIQGAHSTHGEAATVPVGARLRLHGKLVSRWQLDELPLTLTPQTRIDKSPSPGDYIEVRGRLDESGGVRVERLRRR